MAFTFGKEIKMKTTLYSVMVMFLTFLCNSCSTQVRPDIVSSVDSAVSMGLQFRDNPDNEGGNENMVYEPSEYAPKHRPIWMRNPSIAHECLILIIAKDKDFNESNWISFYHGINESDIPVVKSRVFGIEEPEYKRLSTAYFGDSVISFEAFRWKIEAYKMLPLRTMRK